MKHLFGRLRWLALALGVGLSTQPGLAATDLQLEIVPNRWAVPYDVQVERSNGVTVVAGKLRKTLANPGRRLFGQVWVEVLDRDGRVVGRHRGPPCRMSPAKHARRARFTIAIDAIPNGVKGLRVGYR